VLLLCWMSLFLRDVLAARLPMSSANDGRGRGLCGRTLTRRVVGACGVAVLAVVLLWAVLHARVEADRSLPVGPRGTCPPRGHAPATRRRGDPPQPALAPLADYLARCTAPPIHVAGRRLRSEIPVLAHRPFAADFLRGFRLLRGPRDERGRSRG
jgi:hypothetical protein